jgi:alanyl-tRNA synthetase
MTMSSGMGLERLIWIEAAAPVLYDIINSEIEVYSYW